MARESNVISYWSDLIEFFQGSSLTFYNEVEAALARRGVPEMKGARVELKEGGSLSAHREYLHIVRGRYSFDICGAPFGNGFFVPWWLTEPRSRFGFLYLLGFLFGTDILMRLALGLTGSIFGDSLLSGSMFGGFAFGGFITALFVAFLLVAAALWAFGYAVRERIIDIEDKVLVTPIVGRLYEMVFSPPTFYKTDTALMFQKAVHYAVLEVIDTMTKDKGVRALTEGERKPILKAFAKTA